MVENSKRPQSDLSAIARYGRCLLLPVALLVAAVVLAQANTVATDPPGVLEQIQALYRQSNALNNEGKYADALLASQEALALSESKLGPDHLYTAYSLNNVALLYAAKGAYMQALPLYQRSLAIKERALGPDDPDIAFSLNNLAVLYRMMGDYSLALPLYQRSLATYEKTLGPEHPKTASNLNNLALLYVAMGDSDKALPLYQRALAIDEKALGSEHPETATVLVNLADLYKSMGAYDRALPLYQRALAIREKALGPEHPYTATVLNNLAVMYETMGAPERAVPLHERSLAIKEKTLGPDHPDTAASLNNVAGLYSVMGDFEHALPLYQRSLAIKEKALGAEHPDVAVALINIAGMYKSMGAHDKALPLYRRALAIDEKALGPEHPSTATALNSLALGYMAIEDYDHALPLYRRALFIAIARMRKGDDPHLLWTVAENLCFVAAEAKPPRIDEAIFYCKLSVNAGQAERAGAKGLERELRASLTKSIDTPYRRLAKLLALQGRVAEAEQVLLALKDAEYVEFVRGQPAEGSSSVPLTPGEKQVTDELNALAETLGKVYAELDADRRKVTALTPEVLAQKQERRDVLQQQMSAKLNEISVRLKARQSEAATAVAPRDTRLTRLVNALTNSTYGEANVVVMYVPEERTTTVLVTDQSGPTALVLKVGSTTLDPLIDELRLAIREKGDYRRPARALYQYLIVPVKEQLLTRNIEPKTLMLYLTARLRYLPFAALVDDQGRHLVERYRLAVLTTTALDKADATPITNWTVTAFGNSQSSAGLNALPAVKDELDSIVRTASNPKGTLPGEPFLDDKFTRAAWQRMLNAQPGPASARRSVIHVATHFQTQPGDWNRSFLLLGNGDHYEVSELDASMSTNLEDVDLITLSACATELTDRGDGKEFEGLGAVFQKKGAKAVIGTLWPVQDEGGAALMKAFYTARGEQRKASKAAALQSAQLELLTGKVKSRNPDIDLTHPYYWAPFILMGNWL